MKMLRHVTIFVAISLATRTWAAETKGFIISYWCGLPAGGNYDGQYAEVAECNFTHAMYPNNGATPEQNKAILDACEKHGLKYFVYDGRALSRNPGDALFTKNLDAMVADYAGHPALAGYFLSDEPGPGAFPILAAVHERLLTKDPKRLPLINLLPIYVDEKYIGMNYENYVEKLCTAVKPKMLCYDHYALFEGTERDSYFANMETIRRHALQHHAAMGFIFQCTPHGTYRDPSESDLRWQVNTALAYGCTALLYFTYFTPTDAESNFHNGILDAKGNRTAHYAMAKAINAQLKVLSATLVRLKSTAVYHTAPIPKGCAPVPANAPIQVKQGGPVVLGFFKHDDNTRWAIAVNRDLHNATNAALKFDSKTTALEELSPRTGKLSPVTLSDRAAQFSLPPGGMRILKLYPQ
jgi:hypothetical protein